MTETKLTSHLSTMNFVMWVRYKVLREHFTKRKLIVFGSLRSFHAVPMGLHDRVSLPILAR